MYDIDKGNCPKCEQLSVNQDYHYSVYYKHNHKDDYVKKLEETVAELVKEVRDLQGNVQEHEWNQDNQDNQQHAEWPSNNTISNNPEPEKAASNTDHYKLDEDVIRETASKINNSGSGEGSIEVGENEENGQDSPPPHLPVSQTMPPVDDADYINFLYDIGYQDGRRGRSPSGLLGSEKAYCDGYEDGKGDVFHLISPTIK